MFEDPHFHGDAAIGDVSVQDWRRPFRWRRATELHRTPQLFGTIEADNISQGELGDCWLLAALAVLADYPGHIQNLFEDTTLNPEGRYTIHLFHIRNGWVAVEIDDLIPCDRNGRALFAQLSGKQGAVWALLLEKAVAKFVGSYGELKGGSAHWAWTVLMGEPNQARWSRNADGPTAVWKRWEVSGLDECKRSEEAARSWRKSGMRGSWWRGPAEHCSDDEMFANLATYSQANFPMSCAVSDGGMEEKRADGLLSRHEYSILQVVEAHGQRLVSVRNPWGRGGEWRGAWSDDAPEWDAFPHIALDLCPGGPEDDGAFWMPFDRFAEIFGGDINVSPVTLPCPRNSQVLSPDSSTQKLRCPRCKQPHSRAWVLLEGGRWCRLLDGELCFLCLRATCRAHNPGLKVLGVHTQPKLCLAPPPAPRRLEICKYGAACYRRNPQHFHDCFHPSLLPPAPPCQTGCGRSAASGFPTCCKPCSYAPPDLQVAIPADCGFGTFSGVYKAVRGKSSRGKPVWNRGRYWLWLADQWMLSDKESGVGSRSGSIASEGPKKGSPHLVEKWVYVRDHDWAHGPAISVTVVAGGDHASMAHDAHCNARAEREEELAQQADTLLKLCRRHPSKTAGG